VKRREQQPAFLFFYFFYFFLTKKNSCGNISLMKVGDLVREKTKMSRKPEMGIILRTDGPYDKDGILYPYRVYFFDGEFCWMQERFLETVNASR